MHVKKIVTLVFLLFLSHITWGKIKLPAIIADNMVLQRQADVPLWGGATPNHTVTVTTSWNQKQYSTRSDDNGRWKLTIQTPQAGGPYEITFDDGSRLTVKNILIGEVWVCSGQSNMEKPMKGGVNQPILNSNDILVHADDPQLRLFHVQRKVSNTPLYDCKGVWELSDAESASTFSAVGFQYAKMLQDVLHVPVGIIEAAWGGTPIEGWMDRRSLTSFKRINVPSPGDAAKPNAHNPTCLFNGMINPIAGYGIKGFIWYQGENNRRNPSIYKDLMASMVKEWRAVWDRGALPFYYVQIAPFEYSGKLKDSVPYVREAQTEAMHIIPHSGMVVSMDVGNKYTIHPPDKTTIAKRLLYWALGDAYGRKGIACHSPEFKSMKVKDSAVVVAFDHAPYGLTSFDQPIKGFEIAGADKVFHPADAVIRGKGTVVLHSDEVARPEAVRYLFKDWVQGNLFNNEGLPVTPFRTDK